LVKTLQTQGDFPQALAEVRRIIEKDAVFTHANPELYALRTKLWAKSYFLVILAMALIWVSLSGGYVYVKLKKGSRARRIRRVLDRVGNALKREKWLDVVREGEKVPLTEMTKQEEIFVGCAIGTAWVNLGDLPKAQKLQRE